MKDVQIGPDGFAFDQVVVARGEIRALDGFTAHLPDRGITVLFGPSGSGKTTVLRLCNRLDVPTSGRVSFHGKDIADLDPLSLRREVGMVFQRPTPFPGTVRDNLLVAEPEATPDQLKTALASAALDATWLDRDAKALSGGEAQRVCMARTLVTQPNVLLLDEPTSALDAAASKVLEEAVRGLATTGIGVLWVSHDQAQVERIADRVVEIERGRYVDTREVPR